MNKLTILEVKIVRTQSDTVKARADIHFDGFWLKGFKVISKGGTEFVTPPSYQAGSYWRALFMTDNKKDWQDIQNRVLEKYNDESIKESVKEVFGEDVN